VVRFRIRVRVRVRVKVSVRDRYDEMLRCTFLILVSNGAQISI
jgi:hypothetical protein